MNFSAHEYKGLEKYLEKMALKGWKLKSIKGMFLKFEMIQPKIIKYAIDFTGKIVSLRGVDKDKCLANKHYYKMAGWDFICESRELYIYCSEDKTVEIPTSIDEKEKFRYIEKLVFKESICDIFILLIMFFNLYNFFYGNKDASFLANNLILNIGIITILVIINLIIQIINLIYWDIKSKLRIKRNKKILYDNLKMINFKSGLNIFILGAFIFTFFYNTVFEKNIILAVMIFIMIVYIIIINLVIKYINRKQFKISKKRSFKIVGFIGISISVFIAINIAIFSLSISGNIYGAKKQIRNYPIILSDIGNKNSKHDNIYIDENKSFIAYDLYYSDQSNENVLEYNLFESKYEWAVKYNFYRTMKMEKSYDIPFKYIKTLDGDIKIYKNDSIKSYIFVSKHRLIKIQSWNQKASEQDIIDIVYKHVFKD